jgi:hypothetical protein
MEPLDPKTYPAEGLIETYQRLMDMVEKVGPEKVGMPVMCAISVVKMAMLAFAEAQEPRAMRALERGQEKLHAGDALVQAGATCTAAAMVVHARLLAVSPRTLSVQRAGELVLELNRLGMRLSKAGSRMSELADQEEPAGHA